jgi:hypothetical protein
MSINQAGERPKCVNRQSRDFQQRQGRRPGLGHPSRQQSSVIIWSVDYSVIIWSVDYEVWLVGMGVTADNGNSFSRKWMMRVSHHNLEGLFHGSMSSDR